MRMERITPPEIQGRHRLTFGYAHVRTASKCLIAVATLAAFSHMSVAQDAVGISRTYDSVDDITGNLYGGQATGGGKAEGNTITLSIKDETNKIPGNVYVGHATGGNVVDNTLIITKDSSIKVDARNLYAGYLKTTSTATGLALSGNSILVEEGAVVDLGANSLYAAYADVSNSSKEPESMTGNTVTVGVGAEVTGSVVAARGFAERFGENRVEIQGTVTGNVYGTDVAVPYGNTLAPSFSDISVTLKNAKIGGTVFAVNSTRVDTIENLRVSVTDSEITGQVGTSSSKSKPVGSLEFTGVNTVGNVVSSFSKMILNVSDVNETKPVLTGTKEGYGFDLSDKTLEIHGADSVAENGSYQLVELAEGGDIGFNENTKISKTGVFVDRLWQIEGESGAWHNGLQIVNGDLMSGDLLISAGEEKSNENSKTLAESFLGSLAFLNQGAEFIADEGLRAMTNAATAGKVSTFGAIHGGTSRYETGSSVDVDGVTLATGVATKWNRLMLAGFVEAGWANSESHVSGTDGDGDHDYYGVGAALRYEFESPFYLDGSVRVGAASTEFDGRYADANARYDANGVYGSMHVGAGYVFGLTETVALDLYGRYILGYLEGDTVDLGTPDGEKFEMDDTFTHAFRVGARFTGIIGDTVGWRFGVAYEHVADGDAESDVIVSGTRAALDVPSLEGNTGIVEAGLTMRPDGSSPWSANIGIKGYVGDREGVSGNATVLYTF